MRVLRRALAHPAWPHARAALVTFHCVAIALVAMPAPGRSRVIGVGDPRFAGEVRPWARLFHLSDEDFAGRAEAARLRWVETRAPLVRPFEEYLDAVGARQPWSLFSAPNPWPARLVLETRSAQGPEAEGEWEFLSGLPPGEWRRSFFDSERFRSLFNTVARAENGSEEEAICGRLARDALSETPRASRVRCRLVATPSASWRSPLGETSAPRVLFERVEARRP